MKVIKGKLKTRKQGWHGSMPAFRPNACCCRFHQNELVLPLGWWLIEEGRPVVTPALPHLIDLWGPLPDQLLVPGVCEEDVQVLPLLGVVVVCTW